MTDPIIGTPLILAGWKILGSLYAKYQASSVRSGRSKKAKELQSRAEELMREINRAILGGASSSDPNVAPQIKELRSLLEQDIKLVGAEITEEWIRKSAPGASMRGKPAAKPAARKAAAKPAAKKAAAKPMAKKAAAKPVAKRMSAKPAAKAAAKP